jgi:Uncharacterized protein conserved in bacteria
MPARNAGKISTLTNRCEMNLSRFVRRTLCRQARWGKGNVRRLLGTGAGLIFKGSGFYITDYRSDSYKEGAKKESPSQGEKSSSENPAAKGTGSPARNAPAKTPETKAKKDSGS